MEEPRQNSASTIPPPREMERVSVIIPAHRCARHIAATLDSVFAQTHKFFEVIVVNDGCPETEALEQALAPYLDQIKYITQANSGAAIARNRGVSESNGEILAFLDGDDIWYPNYLAEQLRFLAAASFDMVYCDADLRTDDGLIGRTFMQGSPSNGDVTAAALLDLRCSVITSGTLLRRTAFDSAGGFENARELSEDFHLWVRVALSGARIGFQSKVMACYRVSSDGLSGDEVRRVERAIDVFHRLRRDTDLSDKESSIVGRRLKDFTIDLTLARGKALLKSGDSRGAAAEFAKAAAQRPALKSSAAAVLSLLAPKLLRRSIRSNAFDSAERDGIGQLRRQVRNKTN